MGTVILSVTSVITTTIFVHYDFIRLFFLFWRRCWFCNVMLLTTLRAVLIEILKWRQILWRIHLKKCFNWFLISSKKANENYYHLLLSRNSKKRSVVKYVRIGKNPSEKLLGVTTDFFKKTLYSCKQSPQ